MTRPDDSAEAAVSSIPQPRRQGERIGSLDVLRGFALLGILVMNVQLFAMPSAAYLNPTVWGDLTGANYWVWLLSHVLTDQKMMTLFSMLFGAGIVLFADRAAARGASPARLHYRRMFWLLVFGAVHGYLLWHGDILFLYALCAFVVFPLRKVSPRALITVGVLLLTVPSVIQFLGGWSLPSWPAEARTAMIAEAWAPSAEPLEAEVAAYRGGWLKQLTHRVPATIDFQTFYLLIWGFWRAAGLMLLGMALFRLGVMSGAAPPAVYRGFLLSALLVGVPVVVWGVVWNFSNEWGPLSFFYGMQFNYWASLLVSLGWLAALVLVWRQGALTSVTRRLAAVGQMAFSNYILHTLLCGFIFYGHGLGLFGRVERTGQIAIVAAIWVLQLLLSPIWLRHYRFGPLEWLWRSLTYGRRQPFRRAAPLAAPAEAGAAS